MKLGFLSSQALFMPYDHKNTTPDGLPSQQMRRLLEEINKLHCHNHCMIGSGGGSVGYGLLIPRIIADYVKFSTTSDISQYHSGPLSP